MDCKRSKRHRSYSYQNHHAVVSAIVTGVSLTNVREHDWQGCFAIALLDEPVVMVAPVMAVAEKTGIVKSCDNNWVRGAQHPQQQGI